MALEGRIRLPNITGDGALGYTPAFWAIGSPFRYGKPWPTMGDIDIMENVNGLDSTWGALLCGSLPGGPCNEPYGFSNNQICPGSSCMSGFHIYRFEWDESTYPKEMRWYVDGQEYSRFTKAQPDSTTWRNMSNHPGFYLLLGVGIGGNFPSMVAGRTTPTPLTQPGHSMTIDYVAVYPYA